MVLSGDSLRLTACNHVTYNVQDLERATKFWVEVLGIQQIPRMVNGTHLNWLQLPDGTMVHLIQNAAGISEPSHHAAFEVADIDAAFQTLKDKGVTMATEDIQTRNDGQRAFYILDTEGNRIEICTKSGFGILV
jgi:catechol 2,3-dioxygenase-like lactoylglutathione lyase family enzyme